MRPDVALVRALTWFSPAFPTGAFSYSHGLEQAVEVELVTDDVGLGDWLDAVLRDGAGWNDALLLAAAYRGEDVAELAVALLPTAELELEAVAQGRAFARAAGLADEPWPLPVAVGLATARASMPLDTALRGYLHALASNLVSAGVRLIPLGQTAGLAVLIECEGAIADVATRAEHATLEELASSCLTVEWCSMRHETQRTRLFRS